MGETSEPSVPSAALVMSPQKGADARRARVREEGRALLRGPDWRKRVGTARVQARWMAEARGAVAGAARGVRHDVEDDVVWVRRVAGEKRCGTRNGQSRSARRH